MKRLYFQSYAGKYVPAIGYKIHMENNGPFEPVVKIPFAGIAIGDGLCDPETVRLYLLCKRAFL